MSLQTVTRWRAVCPLLSRTTCGLPRESNAWFFTCARVWRLWHFVGNEPQHPLAVIEVAEMAIRECLLHPR
jgi:hypothetical protein